MKKLAFLLAIILLISAPVEVSATTWAFRTTPTLSFNGTLAKCAATVTGDNISQHIKVTMKLMYGNRIIASWTDEGYGYVYMSQTATVSSGRTYKLYVNVSIDGVAKDPVYVTGTC